jgi:DNA-binding transcriptional MerR regulator/DNA gyrase inhibitor GyrI
MKMELQTIGQVSKSYGISARMLRYYEQAGIIESRRKIGYAYRVYDETAILRLRQIIVLRKLRIPVKQIVAILNNGSAAEMMEIFTQNISEIDEKIAALSVVKSILTRFVDSLRKKAGICLNIGLLGDDDVLSIINTLSFSNNQIKETKEDWSMETLQKTSEKLSKLTDRDVRIVYLPPSDVAACQYEGDDPEAYVGKIINKFVRESNLVAIKPDLRHFGFNAPNPKEKTGPHGYEMWVTVPDGFEVPAPLVKKHFAGGLYCAHMIPIGAFDEWALLEKWLNGSGKYAYRGNGCPSNMFDSLEECLNYANVDHSEWADWSNVQLDLLIPIKEK